MKASKILGDEWEPVASYWEPIAGEWRPIGTSYEEVVKVSRDTHYAQVYITQSLIAILQNRIEKKILEIKKNIVSNRRVYPDDVFSKEYIRLQESAIRLQESLNDFKSYIGYIDIQPLSYEEVSMIYLEEEITELIETIQRRYCK